MLNHSKWSVSWKFPRPSWRQFNAYQVIVNHLYFCLIGVGLGILYAHVVDDGWSAIGIYIIACCIPFILTVLYAISSSNCSKWIKWGSLVVVSFMVLNPSDFARLGVFIMMINQAMGFVSPILLLLLGLRVRRKSLEN